MIPIKPTHTLLAAELFASLILLPAVLRASEPRDPAQPLVGAIRWDAWSGGRVTETVQKTLGPAKYHERLPWFAEVNGDGEVKISGGTQAIVDAEISWAARAGLDYWAFLLYPEDDVMSVSLQHYLKSPRRREIGFCLILHNALNVPDEQWPQERARILRLLQEPGYVTVLNGRPLVYEFSARHNDEGQRRFDELRAAARKAGLEPYYVFMGWNPVTDWTAQSRKGFDAVSHYACVSESAPRFTDLVRKNEEQMWKPAARAKVPYIPLVTTGWNKEPRKDHPVPWEQGASYLKQTVFIPTATPAEIALHLQNALAFVKANPLSCRANAIIVYAWNEHDEGGWLVPTWTPAGRPDTTRLDAIRRVLRPDSANPNGNSSVQTPVVDRVAKAGVLVTRACCSAPSCAPARAALLTGRNLWEPEQGAFIQAWLPAKLATLPEHLTAAGYHAGYTGKGWGPGVKEPTGKRADPAGKAWNSVRIKSPPAGINDVDYAANFAQFLEAKPKDTPFYFWAGLIEPHHPHAPDGHLRAGVGLDAVKVPGFLPDTPGVRRARGNYLSEVQHADRTLGALLKLLEDRGDLTNTLVIVTADNGTPVPRAKANVYDWGVHVPLALMWPARAPAGRTVTDFAGFSDLAPTSLEAAGVPVPPDMSGRSVLKTLLSASSGCVDPARDFTVNGLEWHGNLPPIDIAARMIRDERFQYIVNYSHTPRGAADARGPQPDDRYAANAEKLDVLPLLAAHPDRPELQRFIPLIRTVNIGIGGDKTQNVLWRLDHGGVTGLEPRLVVVSMRSSSTAIPG